MKLAFYKGRRSLVDKLIQFFTRSKFSHVELIDPKNDNIFFSSSGLDGGVRYREFTDDFNSENWEIIELTGWENPNAWEIAILENEKKYDFKGIFLAQFLGARRHDKNSWFCSELVAYSLGLQNPHSYSPAHLYDTVIMLNKIYSPKKFAA